jgi:hypothetical protein
MGGRADNRSDGSLDFPITARAEGNLEQTIATVWCDVLELPQVGVDTNFADVGATPRDGTGARTAEGARPPARHAGRSVPLSRPTTRWSGIAYALRTRYVCPVSSLRISPTHMRGKFPRWSLSLVILALAFAASSGRPLGAATWENVTGNLAGMASECGNLTIVQPVPGSANVLAGVALKGLWANSSGTTWTHLGSGAGSDTITNRPSWIVYDPVNPSIFWESGIYNGGGVFKTTNAGSTFTRLGNIAHNDYVSVDLTDPNRQTLLAGGHEQSQTIYKSTNGGTSWTNIGSSFPANTKFTGNPLIINSQTYLVNAQGWGSGTAGLYRTTNGGTSWQLVNSSGPSGPPLVTSAGIIYWANGGSLLKSVDSGATWTSVGSGLRGLHPIELPDGRLAAVGNSNVVISTNGGSTWTPVDPALPYSALGVVYSQARQAFFIWNWDCSNNVLPNAIMKLDYPIAGSGAVPSAPTNLRIVSVTTD